jgi:hypothetical protein
MRIRQVEEFDPKSLIVWNPRRNKWSLYRIKLCGAVPADDLLVHEFDLDHSPGPWVVEEMRRRCPIRAGETSMDPRIAARQWLRKLKDFMGERKREQDRKWSDAMRNFKTNWDTYVRRGRRSDASSRFGRRNAPPMVRAGSERIIVPAMTKPAAGNVGAS